MILSILVSSSLATASISPSHMRPAKLSMPPAAMPNHGSLLVVVVGVDLVREMYLEEDAGKDEDDDDAEDDPNSCELCRTRSSV